MKYVCYDEICRFIKSGESTIESVNIICFQVKKRLQWQFPYYIHRQYSTNSFCMILPAKIDVDKKTSDNCEIKQIEFASICLFFKVLSIRLYSLNVISDYLYPFFRF